jgi:hypothetical protein
VPIGSPKVLSVAGRDLIIFHLVIFYAFILHLSLMISFSKAGWHLPFALLVVTFFLYIPLGLWFSEWLTASQARPGHVLDVILSPETIDALYEDARLHHAILDLTESVAKASLRYGDSLESGGLKHFGRSLSAEIARRKAADEPTQKKRQLFGGGGDGRGLLSGLTDLLGGGGGGNENATKDGEGSGGGIISGLSSLLGGSGNATSIGDLFQEGLSGITGSIVGGLATPAYFLGIGIG